jgi:hypothetical protein
MDVMKTYYLFRPSFKLNISSSPTIKYAFYLKIPMLATHTHFYLMIYIHSHNLISYRSENGWTKYEFEQTEVMSTYLVAFIVSDFNSTDSNAKYNFTAWARPNAIDNAAYSQTVGPLLVDFFEEYTDIEYKFPKIDQVAVPDFAAGAMENWGLITYRYVLLMSCNLDEGCAMKITESF